MSTIVFPCKSDGCNNPAINCFRGACSPECRDQKEGVLIKEMQKQQLFYQQKQREGIYNWQLLQYQRQYEQQQQKPHGTRSFKD